MVKFSEMEYKRPDVEAYKAALGELAAQLAAAKTFEEAEAAFLKSEELNAEFGTMGTIANIRHDINTNDEFYKAEVEFWDAAGPECNEVGQKFSEALFNTPFRKEFSEKYSPLLFTNTEIELRTFKPEMVEDLKRENELSTEYSQLKASAQIEFDGELRTLSQMTPYTSSADDEERMAAWKAVDTFYMSHAEDWDRIYDELTGLRTKLGRILGYENYVPLGYDRMGRNCYTKTDVEGFRNAVVKYVVPLADRLRRAQAKRLGVEYPMSYADEALRFRSGNPRPQGTAQDILDHGRKMYHEMSPETAEFIDVMMDNGLMDVLSTKGKAGGGYCTSLPTYKVPFIFANFNGTQGDVEVITHEAGHAFQNYCCRNIIPGSMQWPSMESCEIHSMSMEFFAWPWSEGFFGPDTDKFLYAHLEGALTFIPYGTMVDHFQHIVFENPDLTPAQRNEEWAKLSAIYMPWLRLDGELPFYGGGRAWQRQSHIYQSPFYYIDYCLAQTVALQFWAYMQKDRNGAWDAYMRRVYPGGTKTFRELLEAAGMKVPFEEEALKEVCETAAKWLDEFDESKLV